MLNAGIPSVFASPTVVLYTFSREQILTFHMILGGLVLVGTVATLLPVEA
jgi:hypothetical protein